MLYLFKADIISVLNFKMSVSACIRINKGRTFCGKIHDSYSF